MSTGKGLRCSEEGTAKLVFNRERVLLVRHPGGYIYGILGMAEEPRCAMNYDNPFRWMSCS